MDERAPPAEAHEAVTLDSQRSHLRLTREREQHLVARAKGGDSAAYEELAVSLSPVLHSIVIQVCQCVGCRDADLRGDLAVEAKRALWQAINRFRPGGKARLKTAAYPTVLGAVFDCITDDLRSRTGISLPRRLMELARDVIRANDELVQLLEPHSDCVEARIAERLSLPDDVVNRVLTSRTRALSTHGSRSAGKALSKEQINAVAREVQLPPWQVRRVLRARMRARGSRKGEPTAKDVALQLRVGPAQIEDALNLLSQSPGSLDELRERAEQYGRQPREPVDLSPSPEAQAVANDSVSRIIDMLRSMGRGGAATILRRRGLSVKDIARRLRVPEGTIKSDLSRARAKLLRVLREQDSVLCSNIARRAPAEGKSAPVACQRDGSSSVVAGPKPGGDIHV